MAEQMRKTLQEVLDRGVTDGTIDANEEAEIKKAIAEAEKEEKATKDAREAAALVSENYQKQATLLTTATLNLQKFLKIHSDEKLNKQTRMSVLDGSFKGILKDPTQEQLLAWDRKQRGDAVGSVLRGGFKPMPKMPYKFTGEPGSISWDAFLGRIRIASMNLDYADQEMKMILMNHLDGKAYTHLISNPMFYDMSYNDFVQAFGKGFKPDLASAIPALAACKQLPKEAVRDFADRIRLAIRPMFPEQPPKIRVMDLGDAQRLMVNPVLSEELLAYEYAAQKCEVMMSSYFMQGLRPDILFSMNKDDYASFEDHVAAAEKAERFAINAGMAGRMMNALTVTESNITGGAQVNYMGGQQQLKDLQNRNGGSSKGFLIAKVRCWNCQGMGHFRRDCPDKDRGYGGYRGSQGSQGSQSAQNYKGAGDQRRGRSTERRSFDSRNRSSSSIRRAAINALGKEGYRVRPGSNSRANSKTRAGSKTRANSKTRPRSSSRDGRTKAFNAYLTKNEW
jgi:hypothetical protein